MKNYAIFLSILVSTLTVQASDSAEEALNQYFIECSNFEEHQELEYPLFLENHTNNNNYNIPQLLTSNIHNRSNDSLDIESQNSNDSSIRTQAATTTTNQNNNPSIQSITTASPDFIETIETLPCFGCKERASKCQNPRIEVWITLKENSTPLLPRDIQIKFSDNQTCSIFIPTNNSGHFYEKIITCQDSLKFNHSISKTHDSETIILELECERLASKKLFPHELMKMFPPKQSVSPQQKHSDPADTTFETTSKYLDRIFAYAD